VNDFFLYKLNFKKLFLEKKVEINERMKLANLAAEAAERRLNANKVLTSVNISHEDLELTKLRTRLEE
jgi:hypothetical protein